jgi:ABC-type sulfate/molybdate transport systems ATPase subunit
LITHDLARGLDLCQRIAILERGKIASVIDRVSTTLAEFMDLYSEVTRGKVKAINR